MPKLCSRGPFVPNHTSFPQFIIQYMNILSNGDSTSVLTKVIVIMIFAILKHPYCFPSFVTVARRTERLAHAFLIVAE